MSRGHYDRNAARERREALVRGVTLAATTGSETATTALHERFRVIHEHSYRGKWNSLWAWPAGKVLTDPEEIAHLRLRGALLEPVDEQQHNAE